MPAPEIEGLLLRLDRAFLRKAWHGPNLLGTLRGLTPEVAAWRPSPRRHNIWELIVHAAYWKYVVRRQVTGEARGSFPRPGSNWFTRPETGDARELAADLGLLKAAHRDLRDAVQALEPAQLQVHRTGGSWSLGELISGAADHDLYHAGQISLIKRLHGDRGSRR